MSKEKNPEFVFDFNYWEELVKNDPEEFDRRKREVIEDLIQRVPIGRQGLLRDSQRKIDGKIWKYQVKGSPIEACCYFYGVLGSILRDLVESVNWVVHGHKNQMPTCLKEALKDEQEKVNPNDLIDLKLRRRGDPK